MTDTPEPLRCQDGCGSTVKDTSEAEAKAWTFLTISKRWRCPNCRRALDTVNTRSQNHG